MGFHERVTGAPKQTDTKTCHVLVVAKAHFNQLETTSHKTWALKQKPWNLPPADTCQVLMTQPNVHFNVWAIQAHKTYPTKTCNISRAMFWPHPPIFHVPGCNPHPCPMTHPWRFKPFSTFPCFVKFSPNYSTMAINESNGIGF